MRRADNVYTKSQYGESPNTNSGEPPLGDLAGQVNKVWQNALGELSEDAVKVGGALSKFPYGSAFKIVGVLTIAYIALSVIGKFGSIKDNLKKLL